MSKDELGGPLPRCSDTALSTTVPGGLWRVLKMPPAWVLRWPLRWQLLPLGSAAGAAAGPAGGGDAGDAGEAALGLQGGRLLQSPGPQGSPSCLPLKGGAQGMGMGGGVAGDEGRACWAAEMGGGAAGGGASPCAHLAQDGWHGVGWHGGSRQFPMGSGGVSRGFLGDSSRGPSAGERGNAAPLCAKTRGALGGRALLRSGSPGAVGEGLSVPPELSQGRGAGGWVYGPDLARRGGSGTQQVRSGWEQVCAQMGDSSECVFARV